MTALEKVKHELAAVKKEYAMTVDKLKRELTEEKRKTKNKKCNYSWHRKLGLPLPRTVNSFENVIAYGLTWA